ncbi:death domain-associated protein [Halobacteriales archaeon QH_9_66_26]|nr:MAG: death domain-associated protein [Halobacteriales archaeon QH_9_66_26]
MGFGSYDESEQDNQEYDTDYEDDGDLKTEENDHAGEVNFEFGESNDELLDRLQDIKEE